MSDSTSDACRASCCSNAWSSTLEKNRSIWIEGGSSRSCNGEGWGAGGGGGGQRGREFRISTSEINSSKRFLLSKKIHFIKKSYLRWEHTVTLCRSQACIQAPGV